MGRYPDSVVLRVASSAGALSRRPALTAVDGQGGSGTSTFARELAPRLRSAVVVEGDDFYRVMPEDVRARLGPEEGTSRTSIGSDCAIRCSILRGVSARS